MKFAPNCLVLETYWFRFGYIVSDPFPLRHIKPNKKWPCSTFPKFLILVTVFLFFLEDLMLRVIKYISWSFIMPAGLKIKTAS